MTAVHRQDVDCQRQAPLIKIVNEVLVGAGIERGKAFDLADQIIRLIEPQIGAGLMGVFHNNLLQLIREAAAWKRGRPMSAEHADMFQGFLDSLELQQRVYADAANAETAEYKLGKR